MNADRALARGCVHWAHPHAEFGWKVFYAYSDPTAGEIGTIYQACNWLYLAEGAGRSKGRGRLRFFNRQEGRWRSERVLHKRQFRPSVLRSHPEWIADWTPDKRRDVWFEGSRRERRELKRALKYAPQPYPRRRRAKASQPRG